MVVVSCSGSPDTVMDPLTLGEGGGGAVGWPSCHCQFWGKSIQCNCCSNIVSFTLLYTS